VEEALRMKVDVAIPDLAKQLGQAATLGEPAIVSSSGFRTGMLELARQVAFLGLLDSSGGAPTSTTAHDKRRRWRPFGGRK
jgi:pilus assembly protein CpaE